MPQIIPFRAYRYNPAKIRRYEDVLTPPYDVISAGEQEEFYRRSPFNYIRLDLRKKSSAEKNAYAAAARQMRGWIRRGILKRDAKESLYVYAQSYRESGGKIRRRIGFISLMRLDPRRVKKHERTLAGPKVDRSALMHALRANLSPIFGFFEDSSGSAHRTLMESARKKAEVDVVTRGVRHQLFVEESPERIRRIQRCIADKDMFIADGHHRFEVSLQYHRKHGRFHARLKKPSAYVLTYLCDGVHNDFSVYPTHRVLKSLRDDWKTVLEGIWAKCFSVQRFSTLSALEKDLEKPRAGISFGCVLRSGVFKMTLKRPSGELDVSVLQDVVIKRLLGEDVSRSGNIYFTRSSTDAVRDVRTGAADAAFILSKIPISKIMRVSRRGAFLPQKSTYFYPKLLSGLVLYKF